MKGFRAALKMGAQVIVASWYYAPSDAIETEIKSALAARSGKGIVMVFAAGNGGAIAYPASQALTLAVIAVGASNSWDEVKTACSKVGENFWTSSTGPALTVVAPGVGIITTDYSGASPPQYIFDFDGTSSAAPAVAAEAALILSLDPQMSATEVKQKIATTADRIAGANRTDEAGWGRVNICKALDGTGCD